MTRKEKPTGLGCSGGGPIWQVLYYAIIIVALIDPNKMPLTTHNSRTQLILGLSNPFDQRSRTKAYKAEEG